MPIRLAPNEERRKSVLVKVYCYSVFGIINSLGA
jgi:hypothetical protein